MKKSQIIFHTLALLVVFGLSACGPKYVHVGPNWEAVHTLESSDKPFTVQAQGSSSIQLGEKVKFSVVSEKSGRLWVVRVDPNDEVGLLFPNNVSGTNWIDAEKVITVPPAGEDWDILADRPVGPSTVAFIVTDPDTDLNDVLSGQHASMSKAMSFVRTRPAWGIDHIVVDVKE